MNEPPETGLEPISPERLAEAGVWVARLHGDEPKGAMTGVKEWLQAHPMNARALELCTDVWEESYNLRRITPFASDGASTSSGRRRLTIAIVAAAIVLAVTGVALFSARSGVSTGVGEQRLLTLKDGTRVFLNTATRVVVEYNDHFRKVELDRGEALFDVVNRSGWPFVVQVGNQRVTALGTSFVVRRDEKELAVTLVEGKVSVTSNPGLAPPGSHAVRLSDSSATSDNITLKPGQRLTLAGGNARLETTSLDKAVAWRRGQIVLDDTPLASAIAEMNRYSETRLVIERPESETLLVNGLFQAGDSMSFARAVAATYGLVVVERDDEIVISGTPTASQR